MVYNVSHFYGSVFYAFHHTKYLAGYSPYGGTVEIKVPIEYTPSVHMYLPTNVLQEYVTLTLTYPYNRETGKI